ncbi:MAG TPA: cell division protein FtsQ/DivIB [Alphaproteobacteria bacterium]|nr:cell division protein FtsQ/DivIB [Alphaproteobacteria bacterium]
MRRLNPLRLFQPIEEPVIEIGSCGPRPVRRPRRLADDTHHYQGELHLPPARSRAPSSRFSLWRRATLSQRSLSRRRYVTRILLLACLATSPVWLWHSGNLDAAGRWIDHTGGRVAVAADMTVFDVLVVGRRHTSRRALTRALGVQLGTPILAVDLYAARQRIEALSWIASASIERHLPDTIYLRITERRPIARWYSGKRMHVVDRDGVTIALDNTERYRRLPLVVGPGAPQAVGELLELLKAHPKLAARVVQAHRLGRRRWDLIFDKGVIVMLPEETPQRAWRRFVQLARSRHLLDRGLVAIDLRLPGRIVLRAPGPVEPPVKRSDPGRST